MTNPTVDAFFNNLEKWQEEMEALRAIVLDCGLTEELKWRVPCYTFKNGNILLIHGFKDYCAIGFFKGALLHDSEKILIQQTKNSQSARQIRFNNLQEIKDQKATFKAYIFEAIEVEKAGLKVELTKSTDFGFPEEFYKISDENPTFKVAFDALTTGRQRAYSLYFSEPKQSETRKSRIEKSMSRILDGKGLRDCTCGLSKRMPQCDGSHKYI